MFLLSRAHHLHMSSLLLCRSLGSDTCDESTAQVTHRIPNSLLCFTLPLYHHSWISANHILFPLKICNEAVWSMVSWWCRCPVACAEALVTWQLTFLLMSPFLVLLWGQRPHIRKPSSPSSLIREQQGTDSEIQGPLDDGLGTSLFSWPPLFRFDGVCFLYLVVTGLLFIFLFLSHSLWAFGLWHHSNIYFFFVIQTKEKHDPYMFYQSSYALLRSPHCLSPTPLFQGSIWLLFDYVIHVRIGIPGY